MEMTGTGAMITTITATATGMVTKTSGGTAAVFISGCTDPA